MGLLSGDGAALLGGIFAGIYLDGKVFKQETVYANNGDTVITDLEYDCKLQVDSMTEAMRAELGAADTDRRILILSTSTPAEVNSDCEVQALAGPYQGQRFQVASVSRDPVAAYFECRGKRAGSS